MKFRKYLGFNLLILLSFCMLASRFYYVLLASEIDGQNLGNISQSIIEKEEILPATRGSIYDVNGNVLAESVKVYQVIAYLDESRSKDPNNPRYVVDVEQTANVLSQILGEDINYLKELLSQDRYETFLGAKAYSITATAKAQIESYNLPGIEFIEKESRSYKYGVFASFIVGYAQYYSDIIVNNEEYTGLIGELGVEQSFNEYLNGTNGYHNYIADAQGNRISNTAETIVEPIDGEDVYLTIDKDVQLYVESAMKKANDTYHPETMGMVIADAKTAKILAASTYPSFNPNLKDMSTYVNPLHETVFEPGSTFKIFTFAAAINEGLYNGSEKYLSGNYSLYSDTIYDYNHVGWGNITFDEGFYASSNVASSILANEKLKTELFFKYVENFGFGQKCGFDLPGEVAGDVGYDSPFDTVTASFGQGISVTPLQMVQALTAISNNGTIMKPYIIDKTVDENNNVTFKSSPTIQSENVLKPETVTKMKDLMHGVVAGYQKDDGTPLVYHTAQKYYMEGYDIIGKTGTAEISENGRYITDNPNANVFSFAGMFPKDDPKVIIYAWVKKPQSGQSAATVDIVRDVVPNISNHYGIFSNAQKITSTNTYVVDYTGMDLDNAINLIRLNSNINTYIIGSGNKIVDQYPKATMPINSYSTMYFLTDNVSLMPNLIGMPYKDASIICNMIGIKLTYDGIGRVTSQSIAPDQPIDGITEVAVTLQ